MSSHRSPPSTAWDLPVKRLSLASTCTRHVTSIQSKHFIVQVIALLLHEYSHRHTRYGLFFHSLALIACIRNNELPHDTYVRYMKQVEANQTYIRKYARSLGIYPAGSPLAKVVVAESGEQQYMGGSRGTLIRLVDISVSLQPPRMRRWRLC